MSSKSPYQEPYANILLSQNIRSWNKFNQKFTIIDQIKYSKSKAEDNKIEYICCVCGRDFGNSLEKFYDHFENGCT